jgi:hypothetical protein
VIAVERVAHGHRDTDRQPLDGLERSGALGARAVRRLVDLIAQRVAPQLVQHRQHHRRPLAEHRDATRELVDAHADLARGDHAHRRAQHQQQARAQQRAGRQQAAAALAAEGFDHAEHDGRQRGAHDDVGAGCDVLDALLDPLHGKTPRS